MGVEVAMNDVGGGLWSWNETSKLVKRSWKQRKKIGGEILVLVGDFGGAGGWAVIVWKSNF